MLPEEILASPDFRVMVNAFQTGNGYVAAGQVPIEAGAVAIAGDAAGGNVMEVLAAQASMPNLTPEAPSAKTTLADVSPAPASTNPAVPVQGGWAAKIAAERAGGVGTRSV